MKPKRRCAKMSTSCFHQALSAPKKEKKKNESTTRREIGIYDKCFIQKTKLFYFMTIHTNETYFRRALRIWSEGRIQNNTVTEMVLALAKPV